MTTWTVPGRIARVIDADTLVIDLDLGWGVWRIGQHVRLEGVDAPEMSTPEGKAARVFVADLVQYSPVTVVSKKLDKYGRVLGAVCLPDGTNLGELLLATGRAVPM